MLEKLLTEIRSGGTFETGVLAAKLDTTPELVEAMLEHLQRAGYIRPYRTCGDACGGCSLREECLKLQSDLTKTDGVRLYTLAESLACTGQANNRPEPV